MLTTLDRRAVLESIADRLGGLVAADNISIEVIDPASGRDEERVSGAVLVGGHQRAGAAWLLVE